MSTSSSWRLAQANFPMGGWRGGKRVGEEASMPLDY